MIFDGQEIYNLPFRLRIKGIVITVNNNDNNDNNNDRTLTSFISAHVSPLYSSILHEVHSSFSLSFLHSLHRLSLLKLSYHFLKSSFFSVVQKSTDMKGYKVKHFLPIPVLMLPSCPSQRKSTDTLTPTWEDEGRGNDTLHELGFA